MTLFNASMYFFYNGIANPGIHSGRWRAMVRHLVRDAFQDT